MSKNAAKLSAVLIATSAFSSAIFAQTKSMEEQVGAEPSSSPVPVEEKQREDSSSKEAAPEAEEQKSLTPDVVKEPRSLAKEANRMPDVHFVVTGGLAGFRSGEEAFFRSAAFRGSQTSGLFVEDASLFALRSDDGLFFQTNKAIDKKQIFDAGKRKKERFSSAVLLSSSTLAIALDEKKLFRSRRGKALGRALAALQKRRTLERVTLPDGSLIWGLGVDGKPIHWPQPGTSFTKVPCAKARLSTEIQNDSKQEPIPPTALLLVARSKGASARAFGIVDDKLQEARTKGGDPLFVDVGDALFNERDSDSQGAEAFQALLLKRRPVALGVGQAELSARISNAAVLDDKPYVLAVLDEKNSLPNINMKAVSGKHDVLFVALGDLDKPTRDLLPLSTRAISADETVAVAGKISTEQKSDLVVGMATSKSGQSTALASSIFDLVFSLVSTHAMALPAVDDIDLRKNHERGFHTGPTLVRVTSSDVTEVKVFFAKSDIGETKIERILVERTPVVDEGVQAQDLLDAFSEFDELKSDEQIGLVNRALLDDTPTQWTGKDLTRLLGGWVQAQSDVEMVILRERPSPVPIHGNIPKELADAWLEGRERILFGDVKGDVLLKIFSSLSKGKLKDRFYVTGGSRSKRTVQQRPIVSTEKYRLAFTRDLVEELSSIGVNLKIIDDAGDSLSAYAQRAGEDRMDVQALQSILQRADGVAKHAFFLEFSNVAFGLTGNWRTANDGFSNVQNTRVQNPAYLGVALDGEITAAYDGPLFFFGGKFRSQFSAQSECTPFSLDGDDELAVDNQTGLASVGFLACEGQFPQGHSAVFLESRDLVLLESEARLVLHRLLNQNPKWTPSPTLKLAFQSEWTPAFEEDAIRRKELRLSAGATLHPSAVWKMINLAFLLEYDLAFEQPTVDELSSFPHFATPNEGALEAGVEASLQMAKKWNGFLFKWNGMARAYLPAFADGIDSDDDLLFLSQHTFRVEAPQVLGIRFGAFADLFLAAKKVEPFATLPAASLIVGVSVSTGGRFKMLPGKKRFIGEEK
ncbi:MAG: hypothetical protein GY822_14840 [Deltaproteobacteria bacterium]|nr:hypothetical protein [Deltaproteobacteria bacterium]